MAVVKPFKGITPKRELAASVSCLPYDVMNRDEAKKMALNKPHSFLHVVRSEIDFPDTVEPYDQCVYEKARENLDKMIGEGILETAEKPVFYIYRQMMHGRVQTGLVARTSIDAYLKNQIKKHEFTRPKKELDRINNFDYCDANTAPIFLTYKKNPVIHDIINNWIKFHRPDVQFTADDDILHIVWTIDQDEVIKAISEAFEAVESLYIADGHHRSASAAKVGLKRREMTPDYTGNEPFNYFMSVIFPDEDLFIMDYNRIVKDLNLLDDDAFLKAISKYFEVSKADVSPFRPMNPHQFGMYLNREWYVLHAIEGMYNADDPVKRLDVSILQGNLLGPILGIDDPRTDERIDFVGGIRGLEELEARVDSGRDRVAFSMYPTTMNDLTDIADAGEVMPPKSTWFEPKLRSGLFIHRLK